MYRPITLYNWELSLFLSLYLSLSISLYPSPRPPLISHAAAGAHLLQFYRNTKNRLWTQTLLSHKNSNDCAGSLLSSE